jgi:DNA modification methylase
MNKLYFADCLEVLKELTKAHPDGLIDLVYIDPPFNSKRDYLDFVPDAPNLFEKVLEKDL